MECAACLPPWTGARSCRRQDAPKGQGWRATAAGRDDRPGHPRLRPHGYFHRHRAGVAPYDSGE